MVLDEMWVGQIVVVVPYSKLKTVCLRRQEADKAKANGSAAKAEQAAANGGSNDDEAASASSSQKQHNIDLAVARAAAARYGPIKRASRWLGDKGRRAEHRGEVVKLDTKDGTVQVGRLAWSICLVDKHGAGKRWLPLRR